MKKCQQNQLINQVKLVSNLQKTLCSKAKNRILGVNTCKSSMNSSRLKVGFLQKNQQFNSNFFNLLSPKNKQNDQFTLTHLNQNDVLKCRLSQEKIVRSKLKKELIGEVVSSTERSKSNNIRIETTKNSHRTQTSMVEKQKFQYKPKVGCRQCENSLRAKDDEINDLKDELKSIQSKYKLGQDKNKQLKHQIQSHIQNINLLTAFIENIQSKENMHNGILDLQNDPNLRIQEEIKETEKINKWLLKQGVEKEKAFYSQVYRLNCQLDSLKEENKRLKQLMFSKDNKIKCVEDQLKYHFNNNSIRQRLEMCREELYSYKLRFQQKMVQMQGMNRKLDDLKYKLTVLTSLIGCAIIFDIKEKENDQLHLRQFMNKIDRYEAIAHNILENNGFLYLKFFESIKHQADNQKKNTTQIQSNEEKIVIKKSIQYRKLFYPNYLALLGEQSIAMKAEQVIIKPLLFIKIRSILDSKYIDYRLFQSEASEFPNFCNSYLKNYGILQSDKKSYLNTRHMTQYEVKQANVDFFKCLLDQRIHNLPEIEIFRQFLMSKWEEDQIYFYLLCRHKFMEGSELQNFINSGDPSKLIKFDKAKRLTLKITESFGRNIQNFVCYHLNQKKILKQNNQFIRVYYLLKLLTLIYRKIRTKKIEEIRPLFENIIINAKNQKLSFIQFHELMKNNFEFISRIEICGMYKQTIAIFQSQKNEVRFFQCFVASCMAKVFLIQLVKFDKQLQFQCMNSEQILDFKKKQSQNNKKIVNSSQSVKCLTSTNLNLKESQKISSLGELWPDSVYALGNQKLNKTYIQLLKSSMELPRVKLEILSFLSKLCFAHTVKQNIYFKNRSELNCIIDKATYGLIEFLNRIQKQKIQHENKISAASSKLGRFFKNKTYEFYHQMVNDINNVSKKTELQNRRNRRYNKEKPHPSKIDIIKAN